MLIPRVIPVLLILHEEFVKTVRFEEPTYVGDPVNVIDLFNRFEVDEIVLLDIRATVEHREPPFALIEGLANECWVPLAYGGGIRTFEHAQRILSIGVEKVVLGTSLVDDARLVRRLSDTYGRQAVVGSVDVRQHGDQYFTAVESATRPTGLDPVQHAELAVARGAGEILLNAIDRDGTMGGYDLELIRRVVAAVRVPIVACGGAGSRDDLAAPIRQGGAAAVAAGSIFVFQGRSKGVLINFPPRQLLERLLG